MHTVNRIIEEGISEGAIDSNYSLYGHRQLAPFESPGDQVYNIIKKWPHWTDKIEGGNANPYVPSQ
jgi:N-acetylmuramoyl-L-alanine amidase